MSDFVDCLERIPFASIIASLVCCVGVILFCVTFHSGMSIIYREIVVGLFHLQRWFDWMQVVTTVIIVIGSMMGIYALLLLIFGVMATGGTRRRIYTGTKCIFGGKLTAAFLIFISYIMNMIWIVVMIATGVTAFVIFIVFSWCQPRDERLDPQNPDHSFACFKLRNYGINLNATALQIKYGDLKIRDELCKTQEINRMCRHIQESNEYVLIALIGAILVVVALIFFNTVLTANYHHITTSRELTEYRDAVDLNLKMSQISLDNQEPFLLRGSLDSENSRHHQPY